MSTPQARRHINATSIAAQPLQAETCSDELLVHVTTPIHRQRLLTCHPIRAPNACPDPMRAKPLRPFPFPLNVGTDICRISRIYRILSGPRRTRFVNRVLAPEEVKRDASRLSCLADDVAAVSTQNERGRDEKDAELWRTELWKTAAFVAGRFAAKEAAIKAHSHRRLTFHDIVVEKRLGVPGGEDRLGSGPPVARIKAPAGTGSGANDDGDGDGDVSALISISHDGDYATAVCVAHDTSVCG
ncbi:hypothetical protein E4U21_001035 [Claviceps maximensis]|nr:hypothetical protein E4U21_001035 [Claviceps maximensis]